MINENIYRNGIKGLLSHYEIETLSDDYGIYKSMFHDATERHQGITMKQKEETRIIKFIKRILCLKKNTI